MRLPGRYFYAVHAGHREEILGNLRQTLFRECSDPNRARQVCREFFDLLGMEDLDAFYYRSWNPSNLERFFALEGVENLDRALQQGKGAILLTAHLGSLCAAIVALGIRGYPITHVARGYPEEQSLPAPFLAYALRKISWMESQIGRPLIYAPAGNDPVSSARSALEILGALKKNQLVSMAIDVLPEMVRETAPVRFLDSLGRFPTNLVRIAHESQSPVIPYFPLRKKREWEKQRIRIFPPLQLSGSLSEDLQQCVRQLEEMIRTHPEHWFSWDALARFRLPSEAQETGFRSQDGPR